MAPDAYNEISTQQRVVLVTGPSGAGRTTAIRVLEDLGYEAIDNLPLSMISRLLSGPPHHKPLALGVDTRNRDFASISLIEVIDRLGQVPNVPLEVLYVDCRRDVLLRRFSETRRRHPLAPAESVDVGIDRDFDLLGPVRARADVLIDTSELSQHDLRAEIEAWFRPRSDAGLAISVQSFSYKRGLPRGIDTVFDCRFLRNPYWVEALRPLDGRDPEVRAYVEGDKRYDSFFMRVRDLAFLLLPAYIEEGKAHFSIAFGCTGGQHRSVAVAQNMAAALAQAGWRVSIRHREMERRESRDTTG